MRLAVVLSVIIVAAFMLVSAYCIYAGNRAADSSRMAVIQPAMTGRSIVVVSPHPDDEVLGTSGLLQQAHKRGVPAHVVFVTSGDGFKFGVSRYYNKVAPTPADFKSYGEMRMHESQQAVQALGLSASDATFLGYPDRGTMAMWRDHWNTDDPFVSPYSRSDKVVYENAYDPGAPFCGHSLLFDLLGVLRKDRPTDIYVTHPKDDHDDHSAVSAFTTLAFTILKQSAEPWARDLKIHYYLVHRGDWPVPQGYHPREQLAPPAQMLACDTQWNRLPLTEREENVKRAAIESYKSQQEMMSRFLESFVRKDEIYGDIPAQEAIMDSQKPGPYAMASGRNAWKGETPAAIDPVGDTILLKLPTGLDISRIYERHDDANLYVRLDANSRLIPEAHYDLHIRAADLAGVSPSEETIVSVTPKSIKEWGTVRLRSGEMVKWHDRTLEVTIPLAELDVPRDGIVFIEAITRLSKMICDRTGPRSIRVHIDPTPPSSPLS